MKIDIEEPWLLADLGRRQQVLSFAPYRAGFVEADRIAIRQVRNVDLSPELDVSAWLAAQMQAIKAEAVAMLTSRGVAHFQRAFFGVADCVATVGLGNAERVGHRRAVRRAGYGTINIILRLDAGLTQTAMIEALTMVAQARTAAVLEAGIHVPAGLATGTGTDCIALACDKGREEYAGSHTGLGEAIGRATYDAVLAGVRAWIASHGDTPSDVLPE